MPENHISTLIPWFPGFLAISENLFLDLFGFWWRFLDFRYDILKFHGKIWGGHKWKKITFEPCFPDFLVFGPFLKIYFLIFLDFDNVFWIFIIIFWNFMATFGGVINERKSHLNPPSLISWFFGHFWKLIFGFFWILIIIFGFSLSYSEISWQLLGGLFYSKSHPDGPFSHKIYSYIFFWDTLYQSYS